MAGHERDFDPGQKFFHFLQEFQARHVRHDHVAENHVYGLLFEQREGGIATIGFQANEAQGLTHGDAQLANGLLVIDDQQANAKIFFRHGKFAKCGGHRAFPIVFSTAEIRSCTRNGFSR